MPARASRWATGWDGPRKIHKLPVGVGEVVTLVSKLAQFRNEHWLLTGLDVDTAFNKLY